MVYDPSRSTVRSQIIENLRTTLVAMSSPDYVHTLGEQNVRTYDGSLQGFNSWPCAAIVPMQDERSDAANPLVEITQRFAITFAVQGTDVDGNAWREQMDRLCAEITHALTVDPYRGTTDTEFDTRRTARTTQIIAAQIFDTAHNDNLGMGVIDLVVEYAHLYTDPTTPY